MENRFWQLLEQLDGQGYHTAAALSKALGVSEKTVRNVIKEINTVIRGNGAEIDAKQRFGYQLVVFDEERWIEFLSRSRKDTAQVPGNADERAEYLLLYLLSHPEYVKLAELGDRLYVSPQTLSTVLRRVEAMLGRDHIQIDRKPYYGLRAVGSEFDKRCCLIRCFSGDGEKFRRSFPVDEAELGRVFGVLLSVLPLHQIRLTEISLQNLAVYVYLSQLRRQQGFEIGQPPDRADAIKPGKEYAAARTVWAALLGPDAPAATDAELCYTAVYIAGKRNVGGGPRSNFVISERTDTLVVEMLESIYATYQIELRENLSLRMMLNQHLQPLDIRLRYGIPVENPILQDIKRSYLLAYTMADQAAVVLREHYRCPIPETEVGWLALIFQMALENRDAAAKLNVLIVCASGKASAQLLLSKFKREFREYIGTIDVCTTFELEHRDLAGLDYIFATVPIPIPVDVPILEIHDFIKHYELQTIKKVFQKQHMQFLQEFYQEHLFFTGVPGGSKEEVLRGLCTRVAQRFPLPEGFYEAVLKRESLGATDYGNLVAIPHPYEILTEENLIAVAVLDKPVLWTSNPVQIVILVALSMKENRHTPSFYNVTTQFMTSEAAVQALLAEPTYQKLMELLYEIAPEEGE